jgi:hypothetical protein
VGLVVLGLVLRFSLRAMVQAGVTIAPCQGRHGSANQQFSRKLPHCYGKILRRATNPCMTPLQECVGPGFQNGAAWNTATHFNALDRPVLEFVKTLHKPADFTT